MRFQVTNPYVSLALAYAMAAGLIGLVAWVWAVVFGFSLVQLGADAALFFLGAVVAAMLSGPSLKKWNL